MGEGELADAGARRQHDGVERGPVLLLNIEAVQGGEEHAELRQGDEESAYQKGPVWPLAERQPIGANGEKNVECGGQNRHLHRDKDQFFHKGGDDDHHSSSRVAADSPRHRPQSENRMSEKLHGLDEDKEVDDEDHNDDGEELRRMLMKGPLSGGKRLRCGGLRGEQV